jgi:hypothetical protein
VPTAACVAVALLLSGYHVVVVVAASAAAYLLTTALVGPFTWTSWADQFSALRRERGVA